MYLIKKTKRDNMTTINTDRIIGFFAPSRFGKTNAIANVLKNIKNHIVIYDTNGEWASNETLIAFAKAQKNISIFKPSEISVKNLNAFIAKCKANMSDFFIYVDDLESFYQGKKKMDEFYYGELKELAERGGHSRIGFIYSAKMFACIPSTLPNNTNLLYVGAFSSQKDLQFANGLLKPEFNARQIKRFQFVQMDRWDGSKELVEFEKVF